MRTPRFLPQDCCWPSLHPRSHRGAPPWSTSFHHRRPRRDAVRRLGSRPATTRTAIPGRLSWLFTRAASAASTTAASTCARSSSPHSAPRAVIVAPDVPARRWNSDVADRGVMGLLEEILDRYTIDRSRILVTGFSLGGAGTWFFSAQHPDFFTGAIPIAGRPGDLAPDAFRHDADPHHSQPRRRGGPLRPRRGGVPGNWKRPATRLPSLPWRASVHFNMGSYVESLRAAGDWMVARWNDR